MSEQTDCIPLKQHYTHEGQGQCAKCEVDFYTAGQGEHYRHLCISCGETQIELESDEHE